ncbi:HAD-IA family hydrolase [Pontibacillus yanchengensis]|uniref:HAD-IA family hydrolase n=2 Tax=Pontibacillus yanchengensis TaxID=462910 RepID=A0ACC7VJR4_9BACI|nr:HAD-IA family hydrolase [Pontibacillus yanchengensis]MYL32638.1 HAD-IA family hydrolase [Pontibacillus yanchengensis]MYL55032.1 HAD-IA family hydrolase [Pontibacillus yanchengensis]
MIKAIIFDFDGLIFDTETFEQQSFEEVFDHYQESFPKEEWLKSIGSSTDYNPYEELLKRHHHLSEEEVEKQREDHYQRIIQDKGPRAGVIEYIKRAKQLQLHLCLASSSSKKWITSHLQMIGIDINQFDFISTSDDVTHVKPDPELYNRVLGHFHLHPNEAIVFEDSPNGSLAAIRASIPCVIVPNSVTKNLQFDHRILLHLNSKEEKSLDEVIDFVENSFG